MNDFVLRKQWQFLLISQIMRGNWFILPDFAIAQNNSIKQLLNRDWGGMDQATDLSKSREPYPVAVVTGSSSANAFSSFDDAPKNSTAILPLKGTMLKYGTYCSYGTEEIAAKMIAAGAHKNISSLVLDIDSGGGAVDAVAPITQAIAKIRQTFKKPIVASVDLAASAAYWSASACSKIVANNDISASVGSIGVMTSLYDMTKYYDKMGVKFHTIYAPESDYKNKPFELAIEGKYDEIKQEQLSPLALAFQNAVKENRGEKLNMEIPGLLNGRMFFAKNNKDSALNAKAVGLIDEVGSLDVAILQARDLAKSNFVFNYVNNL